MAFNINTFKEDINAKGYIKTHDYEVLITPPPILGQAGPLTELMSYRIEQVRTPGISLMSNDINRYGVGPTQKQPYNAMFNEVSFTILADSYGDIWQFWHEWIRRIYDFTPRADQGSGALSSGDAAYSVEYKNMYSTTMSIVIFSPNGIPTKRVDLYQAFPIAIRDMPMSWADQNNLLRLGISVTYKEHTVVPGIESSVEDPSYKQNRKTISPIKSGPAYTNYTPETATQLRQGTIVKSIKPY